MPNTQHSLKDKLYHVFLLHGGSLKHPGLQKAGTFLLVSLLWILFRAQSLGEAVRMYASLPLGWTSAFRAFTVWLSANLPAFVRLLPAVPLLMLLRREPAADDVPPATAALIGGYALFLMTVISLFLNLKSGGAAPFIYFQF